MSFGERLRSLRKSKKLTMAEFGAKWGLAESTISGYERDVRFPDMNLIVKFANYFDVSIDFLLGRSDEILNDDEQDFIRDIEIGTENLRGKYNLLIDGRPASDEEIKEMIAYVKLKRSL